MTRRVQWSEDALRDLIALAAYIAEDSPAAAIRTAKRIDQAAARLGERAIGRSGRVEGTFEKPVLGLPYVIAYEITPTGLGQVISILRVIHTARDWPEDG